MFTTGKSKYLLISAKQQFSFVLSSIQELINTDKTRTASNKINAYNYIECSAKTGENIQKVFDMAAKAAQAHWKRKQNPRLCHLL